MKPALSAKPRFSIGLCAFSLVLTASCQAQVSAGAEAVLAAPTFDLEKGIDGWMDKDALAMSHAAPEAAHAGKLGLRIEDNDDTRGSALLSPQVEITPNARVDFRFWARTQVKNGAGVWVRFFDQNHKAIDRPLDQVANIQGTAGQWAPFKTTIITPANAAFFAFWIHTYTAATGTFDFDDFRAAPTGEAVPVPPTAPAVLPAPVARKSPAYVIIKVDDMVSEADGVNPKWQKLVDFTEPRKIKINIGIIANSLEKDNPRYFGWIKDQNATGLVEFWNHGYDHKEWKEGDKTLEEFKGTSYEFQKQHLDLSQRLAREKLGFPFRSFGAPFNATDANTAKALAEELEIQTWMYGDPKTPAGKVVFDRVGDVNIEMPTFVPDAQKLAEGYNRHPNQDVFVIQGHPTHWDDAHFAQFVQIVDFLTKAGAIFTTPSEYTRLKHPELK